MATVFQKCKEDEQDRFYPCEKARCGHKWTVRYREPGGRTARQREKSFAKKTGPDGADAFAIKVEHDKGMGIYLDPQRGAITLRAWAKDWLERQILAEGTFRNYDGFIRNHLVPHLGRKTLAGLAKPDFERFIAALHHKGEGMAASTINDRMNIVTAMLDAAIIEKRISENPAKGVKLPRTSTMAVDEDEIPTLEEVDLLAHHISPQYRLTIYLMSGAGLRPSEALAFACECRRTEFIRIRWQVSAKANAGDSRTTFVPLKHRAEGEYRDIPIAPFLEEEIDAHEEKWVPIPVAFKTKSGKDRQLEVFFAPRDRGKGTMPTANTFGYHFKKACIAAGIVDENGKPKYTPHSLRHFFASTALANGIPIHEVSRWLGHKSIKITVDTYGHLVPGAWHRCREVMQNAMRPVPLDVAGTATEDTGDYGTAA
ncbi:MULTISPECIES: tyrosine-type recombinase/integrase [unclassified Streptomyces]|uniref:tyrosine-type recombinase/integrase n=1 Tax=unclassified Streptomyces TaxID=2593676 RepID=UPI00037B3411|nr:MULTISPECIES: tyrosine-type recombinase/integrase [unclassified Streptomyces]MYT31719.1 tyrosine-type recombinase/integrase [Streptomyces sp. SID8354]